VRVSGRVFFLERLALPRSATVRVELRDTSRAGAPARTLATQTIPATQGPPFLFDMSVPAATVDPRASLSLFAEIRDGRRLMFTTDTRHPVPHAGASAMEIRLRFVGGGR
jgi:putative lipoprotein